MKKRSIRQKAAHTLVSVFVLAVFILPMILTGRWVVGMVGLGEHSTGSESNAAVQVEPMRIRPIDSQNKPVMPFDEPLFSVTFDDGWESIYTVGLPILQKYGIPTTQYVLSGTFDHHLYMSEQQMKSMQNSGHEFGSHTITHSDLTKISDSELTKELTLSKEELSRHLGPINHFASPLGAYNDNTLGQIKKHYGSHRTTDGDPVPGRPDVINVRNNFNQMKIKGYTVNNDTTIEDIKKLIKLAEATDGWFVLVYHQIDNSGAKYSVTPQELELHMKLLSESNLRCATIDQVIKELEQ